LAAAQSRYQGGSWRRAIGAAAVSAVVDSIGKPVKAVRWFGQAKNYKSAVTALSKAAGLTRLKQNIKKSVIDYGKSQISNNLYNSSYNKAKVRYYRR
jgi:hypothetical protein